MSKVGRNTDYFSKNDDRPEHYLLLNRASNNDTTEEKRAPKVPACKNREMSPGKMGWGIDCHRLLEV